MESKSSFADVVHAGLSAHPKRLPSYLFYDREGSELFERITELPEYYVTRTERALLEARASDIADAARLYAGGPVTVLELGAGTAAKTGVLLRAFERLQGATRYIPADVSESALVHARERLARDLPSVVVRPFVGTHQAALEAARDLPGPLVVLFLGSSIGNYDDVEAVELLSRVREAVDDRGSFLLGTDLCKPLDVLLPAYDDAAGVTAAFNRNVLARINRELGGRFDVSSFRHVARWNEAARAVEMHLESVRMQRIRIDALGRDVAFDRGESIHTESSHKYDRARIEQLFARAGLSRRAEFRDPEDRYSLHLAGRTV